MTPFARKIIDLKRKKNITECVTKPNHSICLQCRTIAMLFITILVTLSIGCRTVGIEQMKNGHNFDVIYLFYSYLLAGLSKYSFRSVLLLLATRFSWNVVQTKEKMCKMFNWMVKKCVFFVWSGRCSCNACLLLLSFIIHKLTWMAWIIGLIK